MSMESQVKCMGEGVEWVMVKQLALVTSRWPSLEKKVFTKVSPACQNQSRHSPSQGNERQ